MKEIKKLQREIENNIKIVYHDHIVYDAYKTQPFIKKCKGKLLHKYFKKWENSKYALSAIYNLSKILKTPQEIVDQLNKAEENFDRNTSYWNDGEEYYFSNNLISDKVTDKEDSLYGGMFTEGVSCFYSGNDASFYIREGEKKERFVAFSKIREFKLNAPNQNFWIDPKFWDKLPNKIKREFRKEGIFIKPSKKYEWFMFI